MEQLSSVSILLVEDNKVNQLVASELLTSEGATVDIADNGSVGVNMLGAAPDKYDVILMDIHIFITFHKGPSQSQFFYTLFFL